jgi:lactoylglutathione lyase
LKAIFTYTGIRVKDLEESVKFYTRVLGMKEIARGTVEGAHGHVVTLVSEDNGPQLELNFYEGNSKFASYYTTGEGIDHLAFKVEDLDTALGEAKNLGYPTVLDMKGASSRWAYIKDPNEIYIELFA